MRLLSAVFGGAAHRRATVTIGMLLVLVALGILTIGANSPYTHANLNVAFDERYDRTEQIVVGPAVEFRGLSPSVATGTDPVARGETLYVTSGCFGCHALAGRGGAVAKAIAGADQKLLAQKIRQGTAGMPPFSTAGLTDAQLAEIGAYLRSLPIP